MSHGAHRRRLGHFFELDSSEYHKHSMEVFETMIVVLEGHGFRSAVSVCALHQMYILCSINGAVTDPAFQIPSSGPVRVRINEIVRLH